MVLLLFFSQDFGPRLSLVAPPELRWWQIVRGSGKSCQITSFSNFSLRDGPVALRKSLYDFARDWARLDFFWIVGRADNPYSCFETLDREDIFFQQFVEDIEAAVSPLGYGRFDDDIFAEAGRREEFYPHVDHGNAGNAVGLEHFVFGQAGVLEESGGATIEIFQITRVVDDACGIAISPFDVDGFSVGQHGCLFFPVDFVEDIFRSMEGGVGCRDTTVDRGLE